jgi:hypothetical protein
MHHESSVNGVLHIIGSDGLENDDGFLHESDFRGVHLREAPLVKLL